MPTTITGNTTTDPTTAPAVSGPAAADLLASGAMDAALQTILNGIAWLRQYLVPSTGGTFSGAVNGITPTAPAHLVRKDFVESRSVTPANLTLIGFSAYGAPWATPAVFRSRDGTCTLEGRATTTAVGANTVVATVPGSCKPAADVLFVMICNGSPVAAVIRAASGNIEVVGAVSGGLPFDFFGTYRGA